MGESVRDLLPARSTLGRRIKMHTIEELKAMTSEERKDELLESTSDAVRHYASRLAMMKAILKEENGISPEDFDKALFREYEKEWDKFKDKNSAQLAMIGMLELLKNGADISDVIGDIDG